MMKLIKVKFLAYKSLVNKEFEITHQCIGLVGKNESGKSNILNAIHTLNPEKELKPSNRPKMLDKKSKPQISFEFVPTDIEFAELTKLINGWMDENSISKTSIKINALKVSIIITLNIENQKEYRTEISGIELVDKLFFLKSEFLKDNSKIQIDGELVEISKLQFLSKKDLETNLKRESKIEIAGVKYDKIQQYKKDIFLTQLKIDELNNENDEELNKDEIKELIKLNSIYEKDKSKLENEIEQFIEKNGEYFPPVETTRLKEKNINLNNSINSSKSLLQENEIKLEEIELLESPADINKIELKKKITSLKSKITSSTNKIENNKIQIERLNEKLETKYSDDISFINDKLSIHLDEYIQSSIPKTVFWSYDEAFVLQSETTFESLLNAESVIEISRPLLNIFNICSAIQNLDDLKEWIKEMVDFPEERSRMNDRFNRKINEYLKAVWQDYDQKLKITIESDKLRIEFYDPSVVEATHYKMSDRSQGAQTFISFLLTIGAEASKNTLSNTILLLDEPENHLHPSGVRYLLEELIKISNKNNLVIYATHSTFMIDKKNYSRHLRISKEREKTIIEQSQKDRIGYFMQEEVLFGALDCKLDRETAVKTDVNFVLEGQGDVILFEKYFELNPQSAKIFSNKNNTIFYHGGGCTNIKKYLLQRPLQLGTKWIFVLDNDGPANNLKQMIEKLYEEYINKEIFILQYASEKGESEIELEDLVPNELVKQAVVDSLNEINYYNSDDLIQSLDFKNQFSETIASIIDHMKESPRIKEYKGILKDKFNGLIEEEIKDSNKNALSKSFPNYVSWLSGQIVNLKKTIK